MKNLIKRILNEQLEGTGDKPLSEKEIRLFKYLNTHKKETKTQAALLDLVSTMMPMIGKNPNEARFYYEVYTANFRPDGDYENLDKNNFKDYREFKQRKTPNNNAYVYTGSKIPFKGSNLEGTWNVNRKNEWYYVVTSYNWYPIYLFINNQWYRVSNNWSSSTSKHLSNANPNRKNYDSNLQQEVTSVTPDEIKSIMDGKSLTDVKTNRVSNFKEKFAEALKSTSKLISIGWGEDKKKVKYTITDVSEENGKIKFDIRINKAGTVEGTNKMVVNPDGYIHPSPFSEDLEEGIAQRIMYDNKDYLSKDNTIFVFQHPN
jgi:hypothetical protein